jgi:hypothetical protein
MMPARLTFTGEEVVELLGVTITAAIASAAWLYQKAWERQERRTARYEEIIDRLPSFTEAHLNPGEINAAIKEVRRLWLFAPDPVVMRCEKFLDYTEEKCKGDDSEQIVGECILEMRKDASFLGAIVPRFWWTKLYANFFKLRTAKIVERLDR